MDLIAFENKYKFLYDITLGGFPVYTCLREGLNAVLSDNLSEQEPVKDNGRYYLRRLIEGFFKIKKFKNKKSLIFTSSMYRRDEGQNYSAEFLAEKYPDSVVFEWPTKNNYYDKSYFRADKKNIYCPFDWYVVKYKFYFLLHKKEINAKRNEISEKVKALFDGCNFCSEEEKNAVDYVINVLPESYTEIYFSQKLFAKLFKKYKNVENVIDFWGSARENISPAIKTKHKLIELQHGIITSVHPGYVYPDFVKSEGEFFGRTILVYGEGTKKILCEKSIFKSENVEVVGNPRIATYKKKHLMSADKRDLILFASQPYENDGISKDYYSSVIEYLKPIKECIAGTDYKFAIKLHPREPEYAISVYKKALGDDTVIYGNTSGLYELFNRTFIHITVSSTTLYEAALFDCITLNVKYGNIAPVDLYGFEVDMIDDKSKVTEKLNKYTDKKEYSNYLEYLKENTIFYM